MKKTVWEKILQAAGGGKRPGSTGKRAGASNGF